MYIGTVYPRPADQNNLLNVKLRVFTLEDRLSVGSGVVGRRSISTVSLLALSGDPVKVDLLVLCVS